MKNNVQNNKIKIFFNKIKFIPESSIGFSRKSVILFFFFYVLIPMLISFILFIAKEINPNANGNSIFILLNTLMATVGLLILTLDNNNHFWRNGFWLLIFFPLFQLISSSIGLINIELFSRITLGQLLNLVFVVIIIILAVIFYFSQNKSQELYNLKNSFKLKNLLTTVVVVSVGFIVAILGNIALTSISKFIVNETLSNQESIKHRLLEGNIVEQITIIFGILITAPIMEELLYRKTLAEITNNKWWVIPISTAFFAFLHVQHASDWENILPFIPLGLVTSIIYFYFRNTIPIIIIHFCSNLVALILIY